MSVSDGHASPRVNSVRIKDYLGANHPVRITGKVLNVSLSPVHFASRRVPPKSGVPHLP